MCSAQTNGSCQIEIVELHPVRILCRRIHRNVNAVDSLWEVLDAVFHDFWIPVGGASTQWKLVRLRNQHAVCAGKASQCAADMSEKREVCLHQHVAHHLRTKPLRAKQARKRQTAGRAHGLLANSKVGYKQLGEGRKALTSGQMGPCIVFMVEELT